MGAGAQRFFLRSFKSALKNIFVIPLPLCEGRVQPFVVKGKVCLPHLCRWKNVSPTFFLLLSCPSHHRCNPGVGNETGINTRG